MSTENTLKTTQVEQPANQFPVAPQSTPDDTVEVGSGRIRVPDGSYYEDTLGTSSVFAANSAPGVYRWDWLCLDFTTAGVVTLANSTDNALLKGTEVGVDVDWFDNVPAIPPQYMPIAAIHITENGAAPDITSADIVDVRSFIPNSNNYGWRVLAPGNLNNLLSSSNEGDKYLLLPGTYTITSQLTLKDNTWLVGSGDDSTGITTINLNMSGAYGIRIGADCVIKNLYISGGNNDVGGIYALPSSDSPIIESVKISITYSVSYSAISLNYTNYAKLSNVLLYRIRRTNTDSGNALSITSCTYGVFDNIIIVCNYSAGNANTLRSVYIGGDAADNTIGCSFSNVYITSPGDSISSALIEHCRDCSFDNFVGSNGAFGATAVTVEGFYYIKSNKNCRFDLKLSNYSGTYAVTGHHLESCIGCKFTLFITPGNLQYGVKAATTYTVRGVYATLNYDSVIDVFISSIVAGNSGVYVTDGTGYGVYLYSNYACSCNVKIIGETGSSGVYRPNSITGTSLFGVYADLNSSLNLDVFIAGNGAAAYGIFSGANSLLQKVYGLYIVGTNKGCKSKLFISGSNAGYGIYATEEAYGALVNNANISSYIEGVTGYGVVTGSDGFSTYGIQCTGSDVNLNMIGVGAASFGALYHADGEECDIYGVDATTSKVSVRYGAGSIVNASDTNGLSYGVYTRENCSICNSSILTGAISGFNTEDYKIAGVYIKDDGTGNTISGNACAVPTGQGAYFGILNQAGDNMATNCIVGNNCGGTLGTDYNIYFKDAAIASAVGNVPNNEDAP